MKNTQGNCTRTTQITASKIITVICSALLATSTIGHFNYGHFSYGDSGYGQEYDITTKRLDD